MMIMSRDMVLQHCPSQEKSKEVLALVEEWGNKLMAKLSLQVLRPPLFGSTQQSTTFPYKTIRPYHIRDSHIIQ